MEVQELYETVREKHHFDFELKKEQLPVISAVVSKKDVCATLPTGYGNSMCYIIPPLLLGLVSFNTILSILQNVFIHEN